MAEAGQLPDWNRPGFQQGQYDDQAQGRPDDLEAQRRYGGVQLLAHPPEQYDQHQPSGHYEQNHEFLLEPVDPSHVPLFPNAHHHNPAAAAVGQPPQLGSFGYHPPVDPTSGPMMSHEGVPYYRAGHFAGGAFHMGGQIMNEPVAVDGSVPYSGPVQPGDIAYQRRLLHDEGDQQDSTGHSSDDDPLITRHHRRAQTAMGQFEQIKFEGQHFDFGVGNNAGGSGHVRSYTVPMGFGMHQYPSLVGQQGGPGFFQGFQGQDGQIMLSSSGGQYAYGEPETSDVASSSPESFSHNLHPDGYRGAMNASPFSDGKDPYGGGTLPAFQGSRSDDPKRRQAGRSNGVRRTQSVKAHSKHRPSSPAGLPPSASFDSLRFMGESRSMSPNPIVVGGIPGANAFDSQDSHSNQTSPPGSPRSPRPLLSSSSSLSNLFAVRQGMGVYSLIDPPLPTVSGSGIPSNGGMGAAATLARSSSLSSLPNAADQLNGGGAGGNVLYRCPWPGCDKVFNRQYNLRSHERTHTRERPFTCDVCEATFSRNHDLKRHRRIHTGSKPYVCEQCGKGFARLDAKVRHLKLVGHGAGQAGPSLDRSPGSSSELQLSLVHGLMPDGVHGGDYGGGYPVLVNMP